ncbi:hypothetical protein JAAARDRAFT_186325 [Jaapia argillacea MUCL 33604]|uniref:NB-ARC domain-containing protein n=1 Tax=Jaapia argillacea MUCL 33604 TaxID=933084 RepID=A0A067P8Z6_9AGAM|nr:hypothetical protein JAAARDRAFT_186325 [Jaapia argillacea MUCL 33604]
MERDFVDQDRKYFRFNVEQGLQNVTMAQWERLGEVKSHTTSYLQRFHIKKKVDEAVHAIISGHDEVNRHGVIKQWQEGTSTVSEEQGGGLKQNSNICPLPTPTFTGREDILLELHTFFGPSLSSVKCHKQRIFVLHGLGGVGKTQIALKFVEECQEMNDSFFWHVFLIDGTSEKTLQSSLRAIAAWNGIGTKWEDTIMWLHSQCQEWLLLIDNANDPKVNLHQFIPQCKHGNILITSRNYETRIHALHSQSAYEILQMRPDEAIELLLKVIGENQGESSQDLASAIVSELGYLPLAVDQAGRIIATYMYTLSKLLQIYRVNRTDLLTVDTVQKKDQYPWSLYKMWKITFHKLSHLARFFLQICAFLHHEGISEDIFQSAFAGINVSDSKKLSNGEVIDFLLNFKSVNGCWSSLKFMDVINEAQQHSLFTIDKDIEKYSLHTLFHEWLCGQVDNPQGTRNCTMQILALSIYPHKQWEGMAFRRSLLPHIKEAHAKDEMHINTIDSMSNLAQIYKMKGQWNEAAELWKRVVIVKEKLLGANHLGVATSMANLALLYSNQNLWEDEAELQMKILEFSLRVWGEDDSRTLKNMENLASVYFKQQQWKEAEILIAEVLKARQKLLDEDHEDVLRTMITLSTLYSKQRLWKEAEDLLEDVLVIRKRVLGENHNDTCLVRNKLAHLYMERGQ